MTEQSPSPIEVVDPNPLKALLNSKEFWAAIIAGLVVLIQALMPQFGIDQEKLTGFVIVIVGYVAGVALDPGANTWASVLRSRKFWIAVVGCIVQILNAFGIYPVNLSQEFFVQIATLFGVLIAGVGAQDLVKRLPAKA